MVNRLFGICYQLMQRDKIPAKELAERYEVSVRTIYRDVEILSMAGVPIYASKGRSGGISLLDHSLIDKMFITPEEKKADPGRAGKPAGGGAFRKLTAAAETG